MKMVVWRQALIIELLIKFLSSLYVGILEFCSLPNRNCSLPTKMTVLLLCELTHALYLLRDLSRVAWINSRYVTWVILQQHNTSYFQLLKLRIFPSKCDFHYYCVIQSQFRLQYQVSVDYPTSLQFFGWSFRFLKFGLHVSFYC